MCRHRLLGVEYGAGVEPEIGVVGSVAEESVVVSDVLGIAEWFEYCGIEGAEAGEGAWRDIEEDVVYRHCVVWWQGRRSR